VKPAPRLSKEERLRKHLSEPQPDLAGGDWIEWCGHLIWEMGATSGGAPYGLTVEDFRRGNEQADWDAPWAVAKRSLHRALVHASGGAEQIDVDYVELMGRGHRRMAFAADVHLDPDLDRFSGRYLALVLRGHDASAYADDVAREARVLAWIAPRLDGLQVPRPLAVLDQPPVLVETIIAGPGLDLREGRLPRGQPSDVVAATAAAVHAVAPPVHLLPPRDRRQHRAELVHSLFDHHAPLSPPLQDARAWMLEHIDRPGPGAMLHGALHGRHFRYRPGEVLGLLDWQAADIGDPAHDLAIATDARARAFDTVRGRPRLLDAYAARSAHEVTSDDLRFFELALLVQRFKPDSLQLQQMISRHLRDA
jgi:aminoglycoside phosphotransferase (APT) family kinase protein